MQPKSNQFDNISKSIYFMCHFNNFHDTIFNVYVQYRIDRSREASGAGSLCVMLFCFHCIQLVQLQIQIVWRYIQIKYCLFEIQPYVQKLFYTKFTIIKQTITNDNDVS